MLKTASSLLAVRRSSATSASTCASGAPTSESPSSSKRARRRLLERLDAQVVSRVQERQDQILGDGDRALIQELEERLEGGRGQLVLEDGRIAARGLEELLEVLSRRWRARGGALQRSGPRR